MMFERSRKNAHRKIFQLIDMVFVMVLFRKTTTISKSLHIKRNVASKTFSTAFEFDGNN